MSRPIRATFLIALGLLLAVLFPLLGLVAACLIAGMGLQALLSTAPGKDRAITRVEPPQSTQDRAARRRTGDWK